MGGEVIPWEKGFVLSNGHASLASLASLASSGSFWDLSYVCSAQSRAVLTNPHPLKVTIL